MNEWMRVIGILVFYYLNEQHHLSSLVSPGNLNLRCIAHYRNEIKDRR